MSNFLTVFVVAQPTVQQHANVVVVSKYRPHLSGVGIEFVSWIFLRRTDVQRPNKKCSALFSALRAAQIPMIPEKLSKRKGERGRERGEEMEGC